MAHPIGSLTGSTAGNARPSMITGRPKKRAKVATLPSWCTGSGPYPWFASTMPSASRNTSRATMTTTIHHGTSSFAASPTSAAKM